MSRWPLLLVVLVLHVSPSGAQAPFIAGVFPEAAAPGATLTLCGSGFQLATEVEFTANVGGFVGQLTNLVAVSTLTPTELTVIVSGVNAFTPPFATPPGNPVGTLRVRDATGSFSNPISFFYMEATFGVIDSVGIGSSNSDGVRAATSFSVAGGLPFSNNTAFELTLDNAVTYAPAIVAFGAPATSPTPVGNGLVAIDLLQVSILPGTFFADGKGNITLPAPVPPGSAGITLVVQWAYLDGGTAQVANGLLVTL